jgi:hypothetical protein
MSTDLQWIHLHATPREVAQTLFIAKDKTMFPVVDSPSTIVSQPLLLIPNVLTDSTLLIGVCYRKELVQWLYEATTPPALRETLQFEQGEESGLIVFGKGYGTFKKAKRHFAEDSILAQFNLYDEPPEQNPETQSPVLPHSTESAQRDEEDSSGNDSDDEDSSLSESDEIVPAGPLPIKPVPIQILDEMPVTHVHMLFITMCLSEAYVTRNGVLEGVITRDRLKEAISEHKDPMRILILRFKQLFSDLWILLQRCRGRTPARRSDNFVY